MSNLGAILSGTTLLGANLSNTILANITNIKPGPNYSVSGSRAKRTSGGFSWDTVVVSSAVFVGAWVVEWGVKIVNTQNSYIIVGVAPSNIDQSVADQYAKSGWYLYLYWGNYYSGPPQNYSGNQTSLYNGSTQRVSAGQTVRVRLDLTSRTIAFFMDGTEITPRYIGIPAGPLSPVVLLARINDEIEFVP